MSQTTVVPRLPPELIAQILQYHLIFNFPIDYKRHQILFLMRILPLIRGHNHELAAHVLETYYKSNVFQMVIPYQELATTRIRPAFAHRIRHLRLVVLLDSNYNRSGTHPLDYVIQFYKPLIKRLPWSYARERPPHSTDWQLNLTELKTMTIVLEFRRWDGCLAQSVKVLRQAQDEFFIPITLDEVEVTASAFTLCHCGCIENMIEIIRSKLVSRPTPT